MKTVFVSISSLCGIGFISVQHIPTVVNLIIQTVIGILTIIYLLKKIRNKHGKNN